ncbi:hypothetical protein FKM82_008791 [Ascaphus truei]
MRHPSPPPLFRVCLDYHLSCNISLKQWFPIFFKLGLLKILCAHLDPLMYPQITKTRFPQTSHILIGLLIKEICHFSHHSFIPFSPPTVCICRHSTPSFALALYVSLQRSYPNCHWVNFWLFWDPLGEPAPLC